MGAYLIPPSVGATQLPHPRRVFDPILAVLRQPRSPERVIGLGL